MCVFQKWVSDHIMMDPLHLSGEVEREVPGEDRQQQPLVQSEKDESSQVQMQVYLGLSGRDVEYACIWYTTCHKTDTNCSVIWSSFYLSEQSLDTRKPVERMAAYGVNVGLKPRDGWRDCYGGYSF